LRLEFFGEREDVADVVAVSVGNQDGVDAVEFFRFLGAGGIAVNPAVYENDLSISEGDFESGVTEPGDVIAASP